MTLVTFVSIYRLHVVRFCTSFNSKHNVSGARPLLKDIVFTLIYCTKFIVININFQLAPAVLAYFKQDKLLIILHNYEIRRDTSRD